jgi:hypothetical protein
VKIQRRFAHHSINRADVTLFRRVIVRAEHNKAAIAARSELGSKDESEPSTLTLQPKVKVSDDNVDVRKKDTLVLALLPEHLRMRKDLEIGTPLKERLPRCSEGDGVVEKGYPKPPARLEMSKGMGVRTRPNWVGWRR